MPRPPRFRGDCLQNSPASTRVLLPEKPPRQDLRAFRCETFLARLPLLLALALFCPLAAPAQSATRSDLEIDAVGKGAVALTGSWQFHLGDDPAWAQPEIDDTSGKNGWEDLSADRPWGSQTHFAYSGYGWYRRHLRITPASGVNTLQVLLPAVQQVCAVYWNGTLLGTYGHFPPHASWPTMPQPALYTLPNVQPGPATGVLAIRVWQPPLGSSSSGLNGGLAAPPLLGNPDSLDYFIGHSHYEFLRSNLYFAFLDALYAVGALAAFLLWIRRRRELLLLWFAVFAACPVLWSSVIVLELGISNRIDEFFVQILFTLRNVALWFVLIDLLNLHQHTRLVRWGRILAIVSLVIAFLDACLFLIPTQLLSEVQSAWVDAALTFIETGCEAYLFVLVPTGFRQKLDSARWIVALSAFISQFLTVVAAASQQGSRFTHWTLARHLYSPLFTIGGVYFTAQLLADTVLLLSILYALFRYLQEQQARRALLEQEMHSARELQNVLIPEKPPTLPGYTFTSAYHPALDVGGDFFQIIPLDLNLNPSHDPNPGHAPLHAPGPAPRPASNSAPSPASSSALSPPPNHAPSHAPGPSPAPAPNQASGQPASQLPSSALVLLGDVSGKGLRAAMAVSLIIGAARTLAETTASPAALLAGISRRLAGRLQGGFTTCLALRLDPDGSCTLASAGHPAPYLNGREIQLPGALPLGIAPDTAYEETTLHLRPGDRVAMFTDGLLEARSASGEVFSFDRLQTLMATAPDADQASQAAVAFGQDDDITVLTLTRLPAPA